MEIDLNNNVVLIAFVALMTSYIVGTVVLVVQRWSGGRSPLYVLNWPPKNYTSAWPYLVSVVTGTRRGSGTTGSVKFTIKGRQGVTDPQIVHSEMVRRDERLFKRGASNDFLVITDGSLGEVMYSTMELSAEPHRYEQWFLSYTTVRDLRSHNIQYYLPLHKWLVASGNLAGQMMVLMPSVGSGLQLLVDNLFRGIRELHVWCSPWTSTVMSSRLDCFLSLSLCHFVVVSFLFAGTLSYASPVTVTTTDKVKSPAGSKVPYILLVVLVVTVFVTLIQLVARMIRVDDGFKLSGYRVVSVTVQPDVDSGRQLPPAAGSPGQSPTVNNPSPTLTDNKDLNNMNSNNRNNGNNARMKFAKRHSSTTNNGNLEEADDSSQDTPRQCSSSIDYDNRIWIGFDNLAKERWPGSRCQTVLSDLHHENMSDRSVASCQQKDDEDNETCNKWRTLSCDANSNCNNNYDDDTPRPGSRSESVLNSARSTQSRTLGGATALNVNNNGDTNAPRGAVSDTNSRQQRQSATASAGGGTMGSGVQKGESSRKDDRNTDATRPFIKPMTRFSSLKIRRNPVMGGYRPSSWFNNPSKNFGYNYGGGNRTDVRSSLYRDMNTESLYMPASTRVKHDFAHTGFYNADPDARFNRARGSSYRVPSSNDDFFGRVARVRSAASRLKSSRSGLGCSYCERPGRRHQQDLDPMENWARRYMSVDDNKNMIYGTTHQQQKNSIEDTWNALWDKVAPQNVDGGAESQRSGRTTVSARVVNESKNAGSSGAVGLPADLRQFTGKLVHSIISRLKMHATSASSADMAATSVDKMIDATVKESMKTQNESKDRTAPKAKTVTTEKTAQKPEQESRKTNTARIINEAIDNVTRKNESKNRTRNKSKDKSIPDTGHDSKHREHGHHQQHHHIRHPHGVASGKNRRAVITSVTTALDDSSGRRRRDDSGHRSHSGANSVDPSNPQNVEEMCRGIFLELLQEFRQIKQTGDTCTAGEKETQANDEEDEDDDEEDGSDCSETSDDDVRLPVESKHRHDSKHRKLRGSRHSVPNIRPVCEPSVGRKTTRVSSYTSSSPMSSSSSMSSQTSSSQSSPKSPNSKRRPQASVGCKFRDQLLLDEGELRKFAVGVMENLYKGMRGKLGEVTDVRHGQKNNSSGTSEDPSAGPEFEIRTQILPAIVEQIVWMIKSELVNSDGSVCPDEAPNHFVETIVTNAVLNVRTPHERAKSARGGGGQGHTKTFVVLSNAAPVDGATGSRNNNANESNGNSSSERNMWTSDYSTSESDEAVQASQFFRTEENDCRHRQTRRSRASDLVIDTSFSPRRLPLVDSDVDRQANRASPFSSSNKYLQASRETLWADVPHVSTSEQCSRRHDGCCGEPEVRRTKSKRRHFHGRRGTADLRDAGSSLRGDVGEQTRENRLRASVDEQETEAAGRDGRRDVDRKIQAETSSRSRAWFEKYTRATVAPRIGAENRRCAGHNERCGSHGEPIARNDAARPSTAAKFRSSNKMNDGQVHGDDSEDEALRLNDIQLNMNHSNNNDAVDDEEDIHDDQNVFIGSRYHHGVRCNAYVALDVEGPVEHRSASDINSGMSVSELRGNDVSWTRDHSGHSSWNQLRGHSSWNQLLDVSCLSAEVDEFLRDSDVDERRKDIELLARVLEYVRAATTESDKVDRGGSETWERSCGTRLPAQRWTEPYVGADTTRNAQDVAEELIFRPLGRWIVNRVRFETDAEMAKFARWHHLCGDDDLTNRPMSSKGSILDLHRDTGSVSMAVEGILKDRAIENVGQLMIAKKNEEKHSTENDVIHSRSSINFNNNADQNRETNQNEQLTTPSDIQTKHNVPHGLHSLRDALRRTLDSTTSAVTRAISDVNASQHANPDGGDPVNLIEPALDVKTLSQLWDPNPSTATNDLTWQGVVGRAFYYLLVFVVVFLYVVLCAAYLALGGRLETADAWHWLTRVAFIVVLHAVLVEPLRISIIAFYWTGYRHRLM